MTPKKPTSARDISEPKLDTPVDLTHLLHGPLKSLTIKQRQRVIDVCRTVITDVLCDKRQWATVDRRSRTVIRDWRSHLELTDRMDIEYLEMLKWPQHLSYRPRGLYAELFPASPAAISSPRRSSAPRQYHISIKNYPVSVRFTTLTHTSLTFLTIEQERLVLSSLRSQITTTIGVIRRCAAVSAVCDWQIRYLHACVGLLASIARRPTGTRGWPRPQRESLIYHDYPTTKLYRDLFKCRSRRGSPPLDAAQIAKFMTLMGRNAAPPHRNMPHHPTSRDDRSQPTQKSRPATERATSSQEGTVGEAAINSDKSLVHTFRIRFEGLRTQVTIRIYERPGAKLFWFPQSHFFHAPGLIGPYITDVAYADSLDRAIRRARDTFDGYRYAVAAGHKPQEPWLVKNPDFY